MCSSLENLGVKEVKSISRCIGFSVYTADHPRLITFLWWHLKGIHHKGQIPLSWDHKKQEPREWSWWPGKKKKKLAEKHVCTSRQFKSILLVELSDKGFSHWSWKGPWRISNPSPSFCRLLNWSPVGVLFFQVKENHANFLNQMAASLLFNIYVTFTW